MENMHNKINFNLVKKTNDRKELLKAVKFQNLVEMCEKLQSLQIFSLCYVRKLLPLSA